MSTTTSQDPTPATSTNESTSSPRLFYVGMAVFMIAIVFAGFWPSYFRALVAEQRLPEVRLEMHWITHLHAAVFLGWMALLLGQTVLAGCGRIKAHMRVGRYGFGLGIAVFLIGVVVTFLSYRRLVGEGAFTWAQAPVAFWQPLHDMVQFSILLALGFLYRTRPEAHKRYMLFATAALLHAAIGPRMEYLLGAWSLEIVFAIIVGLILAYDLYIWRRLHPASLIGTVILGTDVVLRALLG